MIMQVGQVDPGSSVTSLQQRLVLFANETHMLPPERPRHVELAPSRAGSPLPKRSVGRTRMCTFAFGIPNTIPAPDSGS